jgi:hypothetical protein
MDPYVVKCHKIPRARTRSLRPNLPGTSSMYVDNRILKQAIKCLSALVAFKRQEHQGTALLLLRDGTEYFILDSKS